MTGNRQPLSIPSFEGDLDNFTPRYGAPKSTVPTRRAGQGGLPVSPLEGSRTVDTRRAVDAVSGFPSREAASDGQLNLKGPRHVLDRFKAMCKSDRRACYDTLESLMDNYEGRSPHARWHLWQHLGKMFLFVRRGTRASRVDSQYPDCSAPRDRATLEDAGPLS